MPKRKLQPQDRLLLAVNDLATAELLHRSSDWQVHRENFVRQVPQPLRTIVQERLREIVGSVMVLGLMLTREPVPETTQTMLVLEMADVIFQGFVPDDLQSVYQKILETQHLSEVAGYALLAIWAKQLAEEGSQPLLWQQDQRIVWLRENHRALLEARA